MVLGGGAGLAAVWLIDARGLSDLFGRFEWRSLRRTRQRDTTRHAAPRVAETTYEPVAVAAEGLPARSATGGRDGKRVPAAYTAVEGTYRDVARVPLRRKLISLVALVAILSFVGVAIAALAGATLGAIAGLVDGAVG